MSPNATHSKWLFFALILLTVALLTACAEFPQHLWLEAPGWSRAKWIDTTAVDFPGKPARDENGNSYFLLVQNQDGIYSPNALAIDQNAATLWAKQIPFISEERIESPSILISGHQLLLFWIESDILYHLLTDLEGEPLGEVQIISGSRLVDSYQAVLDHQGQLSVWFSGPKAQPGLYIFDPTSGISLVDAEGYNPQLQRDPSDGLHAIWLRNQPGESEHQIFYAVFPNGRFETGREQHIHSTLVSVTSGLSGPVLGLDSHAAYVLWSVVTRTGPSAGDLRASFITFPLGDPDAVSAEQRLRFPNGYHLLYEPVQAQWRSGERAVLQNQQLPLTSKLSDLTVNDSIGSEMVLSLRARLPYLRNKESAQIGLAYLQDGAVEAAQLLSFTSANSQSPSVLSDEEGYLYATWLEGASPGPYRVYYAGTAPALRQALDNLGAEDYLQLAAEIGFGLISGMVLIPFPLSWGLIPALFILFSGGFRREAEPFTARGTLITLILAFIMYWVSKLTTLSGIFTYVPFSAWLPFLSDDWHLPLRIGVPLLTTMLALYIAWRTTYRRERNVPLFFILIFVVVDGLISISIYGVIFYNAV